MPAGVPAASRLGWMTRMGLPIERFVWWNGWMRPNREGRERRWCCKRDCDRYDAAFLPGAGFGFGRCQGGDTEGSLR